MRLRHALPALAALTLVFAACTDTARRSIPLLGPMEIDDPTVALGERLFMRNCNQCHPRGASGLGPALNDKPLPDFVIRAQVRAGLGAMPAFSEAELGDEELDAVIAYLDHLRGRGPFENWL